jgi:hypothetical protein
MQVQSTSFNRATALRPDRTRALVFRRAKKGPPIGPNAADLFPIDRGGAGRLQGLQLAGEMLVLGADPHADVRRPPVEATF